MDDGQRADRMSGAGSHRGARPRPRHLEPGWHACGGVATAWFDAPSLRVGAQFAKRIAELSDVAAIDLRPTGVRVRLDAGELTSAVSAAARELGLHADPAALQQLGIIIESANPDGIAAFWPRVLGYPAVADQNLRDPLRRDPDVRIHRSTRPAPLRNRLHLDVVRPSDVVERAGMGEPSGPYGVCHRDPDGNEVDLVPGEPLGVQSGTADWRTVFGSMACYRVSSAAQQHELVAAAAATADDIGFPLLLDLRPGLVIMDSGKDRWEGDAHECSIDFTDLAAKLQTAARDLGAVADPELPRLVQVVLDAASVASLRAFWVAALGYAEDRRTGVTDIYDPRRLNPVLVFQELDAADEARRRQRNRIHLELAVPSLLAEARVASIVAAGGRVTDESEKRWRISDPEDNELVIIAGS